MRAPVGAGGPRPRPRVDRWVPRRNSLRTKGFAATLLLLLYLVTALFYVSAERDAMYDGVARLQALSRHDKALAVTEATLAAALVKIQQGQVAAAGLVAVPREIDLYMDACARDFAALEEFDPGYARVHRAIERGYAALRELPRGESWSEFERALSRASDELELRRGGLSDEREQVMSEFQAHYDAVTVKSLLLVLLGVAVFGTVVAYFFARLTRDIGLFEAHAKRIVQGWRGGSLPVDRHDELGSLMRSVNQMSDDLDQREKQLEVEGQRQSHQEKMAAVGALAAGIAHEVNNPLAVISGVAHELAAAQEAVPVEAAAQAARVILEQLQRAAGATRQLAEAVAPHAAEREWTDLNALVRQVAQFMGYDRRYRQIAFRLDLDPNLPALCVVRDPIQQVLMQLLALACEALGTERAPGREVRLSSRVEAGRLQVSLKMAAVPDFTRPEVRRVVSLCRANITPYHGELVFGQEAQGAYRITLALPADGDSEQG